LRAEDFHAPQAGRLMTTIAGALAFVPAPLPPAIEYDPELVLALSRADGALSELSGLGRQLPDPHLLIAPYLRQEAVLSSRIEGTVTTLSELLIDQAGGATTERARDDLREVRNYVTAMEHGLARLADLPLSLRLVRELHEQLMQGVRGGTSAPGAFRRIQNWIGPPGSTLTTATYVPPPVPEMTEALGLWERFLNERDTMPALVQCALMHEHFEAIHPFLDGNGRVGRLLVTMFLVERERLAQPLLYLSAYIDAHRDGYYDALLRVRTDGDWRGWLLFFLAGVEETAQRAAGQAGALMDLRERYHELLRRTPRAVTLVDELFRSPYITVATAAKALGVSTPTATRAIERLLDAKVLEDLGKRAWRRVFVAPEIMSAIETPLEEM
jgi:cell filamentation protein, protein adenylyltransferase